MKKIVFWGVSISLVLQNLAGFSQNLTLWDGETPNVETCTFSNGNAYDAEPHAGIWAFEAHLDKFNTASINLKCQNTWRSDISYHSTLTFYAKTNTPGTKIALSLYGWPNTSPAIDISPYISGGILNNTYQKVSIPLTLFKTDNYGLFSVEMLLFKGVDIPAGTTVSVVIDDIQVIDEQANKVDTIQILSAKALRLDISDRYPMMEVLPLSNYTITSPNDPDYLQKTEPEKVGRHFYVTEYAKNTQNPRVKNELFLYFSKPFKNGNTYTLSVSNVPDLSGNNFASPQQIHFTFNDQELLNSSVKVNQVGYLPWGKKFGYVGNYLGDAGSMPLFPTSFELRDASTQQAVLNGIPDFRGKDAQFSGELIYQCDFSSFNTPGNYYLYVPGVGRSFPFKIGDNALDSVYYTTARGLFYQRCGSKLAPPYADAKWAHEACHQGDGIGHPSWLTSPLYNGEVVNVLYPATKGWHDAGDYGKYTTTAGSALYYLLTMYELYPQQFADGELNLPESTNGIPDVLDEAKYELDWLLAMQAIDAGVYKRLNTINWPTTMPEDDAAIRYITEKGTHSTGQFAAVMAMAYRVFLPFLPDYAKDCLLKAKKAMSFLLIHPDTEPPLGYNPNINGMGGSYYDFDGDQDERAWASAELYKATGDLSYRDLFDYFWSKHDPLWGWNPFQHYQINASVAYASTVYPTDEAKVASIKNAYKFLAENTWIPRTDASYYRVACRTDVPNFIGFGNYGQSTKYSWDLLMAYHFTGIEKYKTYALLNVDVQLGNNPINTSFITGVGAKSPLHPTHHPSLHDNVVEPVPGIPVYGPNVHMTEANIFNQTSQNPKNLYPIGKSDLDPYPILRRYYDISENVPMSEFNIIDQALTSSVFAFFKSAPLNNGSNTKNIKLTYFKAKTVQNSVNIWWEMAYEHQVSTYVVERSSDGITFTTLGNVASLGESASVSTYQYSDMNPLKSGNYYRLKIELSNGTAQYSGIVFVASTPGAKERKELSIYPNPANTHIRLAIPNTSNQISVWELRVIDFTGQVKLQAKSDLFSLNERLNKLLATLRAGVYLIQVKGEKGEEYSGKLIKN